MQISGQDKQVNSQDKSRQEGLNVSPLESSLSQRINSLSQLSPGSFSSLAGDLLAEFSKLKHSYLTYTLWFICIFLTRDSSGFILQLTMDFQGLGKGLISLP